MKKQWDQSSLILTQKKAHSQEIISISIRDEKTFLTNSQDSTIRLWDLRNMSSVKMVRNKCLEKQQSSLSNDNQNKVFVGCEKQLFSFDLRKGLVFIQQIEEKAQEPHLDQINHIVFSKQYNMLAVSDDEGDTRIYNSDLKILNTLDQMHVNLSYSSDFIYPKAYNYPICVTSGYDCLINIWDTKESTCLKKIKLVQIFNKEEITSSCPPLIHCLKCYNNSIFVGTQTGHIACFSFNKLNKPKFILDASLCSIKICRLAQFNQNILISLSSDRSFSFFDYTKREKGYPQFISKHKLHSQPYWLETTSNHILVATSRPELSIFTLKG